MTQHLSEGATIWVLVHVHLLLHYHYPHSTSHMTLIIMLNLMREWDGETCLCCDLASFVVSEGVYVEDAC